MRINPFWPHPEGAASVPYSSRLITEAEFANVYAAAEFAWAFDLVMDQTITITWRLFGPEVEADAQGYFVAYLKALRDWLHRRGQPQAWVFAHENGPVKGLHTHLAIHIDPGFRREFKSWNQGWATRQMKRKVPRGIRLRGPLKVTPWLHWLLVSYLLKGYDPAVVVQSGRNAPDRRDVLLGDLICFPWHDPGVVPLKNRVGWSDSLGPGRRALGAPGVNPLGRTVMQRSKNRCKYTLDLFAGCGELPASPMPSLVGKAMKMLAGRPAAELANMQTALAIHPWLNSPEDQTRLKALKSLVEGGLINLRASLQTDETRIRRIPGTNYVAFRRRP